MSGAARAAIIGVIVAAVFVAVSAVVLFTGVVTLPVGGQGPDKVLVIAAAEDQTGADSAAIAYVADAVTGQVTLLDTLEEATVAGTSARNSAEALPFGGGEAVAEALAPQTGGKALEWILLPQDTWQALVDEAGGVTVEVPQTVSAYTRSGGLTVIDAGRQQLKGGQAVALATAVRFGGTREQQREMLRQLTAGVSAVAGARGSALRRLVQAGRAESSLEAADIPDLSSVQ